jgi:hypothetical protein
MSRRTVFLGAATQRRVDVRGPQRRSWPDIDLTLTQQQTAIEELDGARALCLGYETDWDLVRVVFSGSDDAELLGPGRVLNCADGSGNPRRIARIEPVTPAPATRLYDATGLRRGVTPAATPQTLGTVYDTASGFGRYKWMGTGTITVYRWNGSAWEDDASVPSGNFLPFTDDYAGDHPNTRPVDYSFDAIFTIADLIFAGLMAGQAPYRSAELTDAHGQAGDPAEPPTQLLPPPVTGTVTYANLAPLFYARLAVDMFDSCPPANYEPELAPARYISFPDIAVPAATAAAAGPPAVPPQMPLITIPIINARGVELVFRNTGAGTLHALLVTPTATDAIDDVGGVWNTDPTPAVQYEIVGPGEAGSLVLDRPRHPYTKILVGSDTGAVISDAVLSVKREMDR